MAASWFQARVDLRTPAFAWHERPGALERMIPPWERVRVVERTGTIHDGDRVVLETRGMRMEHVHRDYVAGRQFVDEQVRGPFRTWVHTHSFDDRGLVDSIEYDVPIGGRYVARQLQRMFAYRHAVLADDLERHAEVRERAKIAITGASGVLGRALSAFLSTGGHDVLPLVRGKHWDPARGEIDVAALEGVDAIVHLAGAAAGRRWTEARKREILRSRVDGTALIARAIAEMKRPPRVLVSASAIGIYGIAQDGPLDEEAALGDDFLADVCRQWEAAAVAPTRVVNLRIGVVLTPAGGALAEMLPVFKLGLGGPIGSGRQMLSWISPDDAIAAIHHAMFSDLRGPLNLVAPHPVENREFAATLARVLHRPAVLRVPARAIELAFGEMGRLVALGGAEVVPRRLGESGFRFAYPELEPALRHVLGLPK